MLGARLYGERFYWKWQSYSFPKGKARTRGTAQVGSTASRRGTANRLTSGGEAGPPLERFLLSCNRIQQTCF